LIPRQSETPKLEAAWLIGDWLDCFEHRVADPRELILGSINAMPWRPTDEVMPPPMYFQKMDIKAKLSEPERELAALKLTQYRIE
jgi:hypothetical protein